jgi:hypothetical protein
MGVLAILIWLNTYPSGRGQHSEDDDENDLFKHLTDSTEQVDLGRTVESSQPEQQFHIIHGEPLHRKLLNKLSNIHILKR